MTNPTPSPEQTVCGFGDPTCPCQDGDPCHYVAIPRSPAMTAPVTPSPTPELTPERLAEIRRAHAERTPDTSCVTCDLLAEIVRLTLLLRQSREVVDEQHCEIEQLADGWNALKAERDRLRDAVEGPVWEPTLEAALQEAVDALRVTYPLWPQEPATDA